MENYYFMRTVLSWLAEPRNFNRMLAITLRAIAVLIVPLSLVAFFKAGKVIFELPASGILGGIRSVDEGAKRGRSSKLQEVVTPPRNNLKF